MIRLPAESSGQFTQMHGRDGRIRLHPRQALQLQLQHYFSEDDADVLADARADLGSGILRAGMVEWQGECSGQIVSIGWDWALLAQGDIAPVLNAGPRSNLQLLDPKGYDLQGPRHDQALWGLICQLPWEEGIQMGQFPIPPGTAPRWQTH